MKWCHGPAPGVPGQDVTVRGWSEGGAVDTRAMSLTDGGTDRLRPSVQTMERLGRSITAMRAIAGRLS